MKITCWLVALMIALAITQPARAADAVGPQAFYGHYVGKGTAHDPHATALGFDYRDLAVEIGAAEGGFFVSWTTVIQSLIGKDRRKITRVTFQPSGRPGLYIGHATGGNPADGMNWATISGRALTVRELTIRDDGGYEIHSYQRTLTKDGLSLVFRSDRDGIAGHIVAAQLEKQTH